LTQDDQITQGFNVPFNSFGAQIALAMKARQNVTDARLHLDSWKQSLKTAENAGASAKLEQYRNDVEQAEDKLVASTEEAISLMKQVLENPEPIKSLSAFVKAYVPDPTLHFHAAPLPDVFPLLFRILQSSRVPRCCGRAALVGAAGAGAACHLGRERLPSVARLISLSRHVLI
jgi:hypothetical protein